MEVCTSLQNIYIYIYFNTSADIKADDLLIKVGASKSFCLEVISTLLFMISATYITWISLIVYFINKAIGCFFHRWLLVFISQASWLGHPNHGCSPPCSCQWWEASNIEGYSFWLPSSCYGVHRVQTSWVAGSRAEMKVMFCWLWLHISPFEFFSHISFLCSKIGKPNWVGLHTWYVYELSTVKFLSHVSAKVDEISWHVMQQK